MIKLEKDLFVLADGQLNFESLLQATTPEFVDELKFKLKEYMIIKSVFDFNENYSSLTINIYAEGEYGQYAFLNVYYSGREYFSINLIHSYTLDDLGFKIIKK